MTTDEIIQKLYSVGWTKDVSKVLGENIYRYKGTGRSVVFDFDNTIICGDIGEKVLDYFSTHAYNYRPMHSGFSPEISIDGTLHKLEDFSALEYYTRFLSYSAESFEHDPYYKSIPYSWAVQIMEGISLKDLMDITQKVFPAPNTQRIKPFFYKPILELLVLLHRFEFDIKIITASNVWSVRKIIFEEVNPLLEKLNIDQYNNTPGISSENIIGMEVLLKNRHDGHLRKDKHLLSEIPGYADLDDSVMDEWLLSSSLNFPVTAYEGKPAAYYKHFGTEQPLFCFGDTTSDIDLLKMAEQPIWLARMENPLEIEKVWNLWKAKDFLKNNVQPIEAEIICDFLNWEMLKDEDFLNQYSNNYELRKSLKILREIQG